MIEMTENRSKWIEMDWKLTRIWGKSIEIAENWPRWFRTEGGAKKHLASEQRELSWRATLAGRNSIQEGQSFDFSVLSKGEAREGPKRVRNKLVITAVMREHLQHLKIELA